jgi:hypothetical protein
VVAYEDLLQTAEGFAQKVLKELATDFPEIAEAQAFRLCWQEVLQKEAPAN